MPEPEAYEYKQNVPGLVVLKKKDDLLGPANFASDRRELGERVGRTPGGSGGRVRVVRW